MKMTGKIEGVFEVYCGSSFSSSIFLKYWVLVSIIFKIFILIPNFILIIFQPFFLLNKRERVTRFKHRERKLLLVTILIIKTGVICVKCFHITRGLWLSIFYLKNTRKKKTHMDLGRFLGFGFISGFGSVFCVF